MFQSVVLFTSITGRPAAGKGHARYNRGFTGTWGTDACNMGLIHEQKPYRQNIAYKIEKAPCYSATVLNIPSSTQLTEEDICYAAEQITEVLGGDEG